MVTEDFINTKIDELVNKLKQSCESNGINLTEENITYFRSGLINGISIAGLALVSIDPNKLTQ